MGIRLKDIAGAIGLVGQAVPIVKGIIGKKKSPVAPVPEIPNNLYRDDRVVALAKGMAEAAGKNASVAPQLLMADIMFGLVDAIEDGRLILPQLTEVQDS